MLAQMKSRESLMLNKLNQWLTLVANLGVFVGIILLVFEIQQNTESIDQSRAVALAQVYQDRANSRIELNTLTIASDSLASIDLKLFDLGWPQNVDAIKSLDPLELYRFRARMSSSMVRLDNSYYQYRLGLLDEDVWYLSKRRIKTLAETWKHLELLSGSTTPFQSMVKRVATESPEI